MAQSYDPVIQALEARVQALEDASGGSGDGAFLHAQVILTDAQIKALPTTPFTLVAAVANKIIVPVIYSLDFDWTADYTNIDVLGDITINNDTYDGASGTMCVVSVGSAGFFDAGESMVVLDTTDNGSTLLGNNGAVARAGLGAGQALKLYVDNKGDGPFTGGNAANRLIVDIFYLLVDAA